MTEGAPSEDARSLTRSSVPVISRSMIGRRLAALPVRVSLVLPTGEILVPGEVTRIPRKGCAPDAVALTTPSVQFCRMIDTNFTAAESGSLIGTCLTERSDANPQLDPGRCCRS